MTTLFSYPEIFLGHDLLLLGQWLEMIKDDGLSAELQEKANHLYRQIVDENGDTSVEPMEVYRARDWSGWAQSCVSLGDAIERETKQEGPALPPTYTTQELFESVLRDFRDKRRFSQGDNDYKFEEFT